MTSTKDKAPSIAELDLENPSLSDVELSERPTAGEHFNRIMSRHLARRVFLQGSAATVVGAAAAAQGVSVAEASNAPVDGLTFEGIQGDNADTVTLTDGYTSDVIIRWGDPLFAGVEELNTNNLRGGELLREGSGERAAQQFGFNCDAVEFFPIVPGSNNSRRGLVAVNHEYTEPDRVFPGFLDDPDAFAADNPEYIQVELANHGISVVEVARLRRGWTYRQNSFFNRRITATTPMDLTGPAAGDDLLKTAADETGTRVLGTLNNCAGGQTPWGTYLSAEENVDQYFGNYGTYLESADADENVIDAHRRLPPNFGGLGATSRRWEVADERFDLSVNPTELLRFGWVVEVDPYNPNSVPQKKTAIGRFKHECATTILAADNRCVVYSGDDARDEYMYKFVTEKPYDPAAPRAEHLELLDSGTLYAAKLNDDGTGEWLPLVWGQGPLTAENGFTSQAEVLIKARAAADTLGATPMDRPEDFEANPVTKKVYCALTNNTRRQIEDPEGTRNAQGREVSSFPITGNPRGPNRFGHILEITEEGDDNAATTFQWEIFMLCGDPSTNLGSFLTSLEDTDDIPLQQGDTYFAGYTNVAEIAPIGSPDNLSFDNKGNLWIVTDGSQPDGSEDGTFAVPTFGPRRGRLQRFMTGPVECEVCGAEFTPDNTTIFLNIQHPGERGTLENPTSYWPDSTIDGGEFAQPRPSLIAVRDEDRFGNRVIGE